MRTVTEEQVHLYLNHLQPKVATFFLLTNHNGKMLCSPTEIQSPLGNVAPTKAVCYKRGAESEVGSHFSPVQSHSSTPAPPVLSVGSDLSPGPITPRGKNVSYFDIKIPSQKIQFFF